MVTAYPKMGRIEPSHRQELALQRIELAVTDLTTVLMASSCSREAADTAMQAVRKAMGRVVADILATD